MSVAQCEAINAALRARGFTVHEYPGWRTRGVSMSTAFEGGIVHHTATPYGTCPQVLITGRGQPNPLPGPLANYSGNADGSLTVIAAGVANHAGASGGRSMGPLPVTSSFNRRVLGLEIVYPGSSPMTDAQYRAATAWARAVADVVGYGDIQRVRAHAETSITGKWDPGYAPGKTIDMNKFRADAGNPGPVGDNDMTPQDVLNLRPEGVPTYNEPQTLEVGLGKMYYWLANLRKELVPALQGQVAALRAEVAALKAAPAPAPAPVTPVNLDYAALAKAVCDEQDRRARDGDSATGPVS